MRLTMKPGQMLRIMNQDVDMHRMMELSGPTMMALGGPMSQGQVDTLTFAQPGVYRFETKALRPAFGDVRGQGQRRSSSRFDWGDGRERTPDRSNIQVIV